jgi:hypothetical protein
MFKVEFHQNGNGRPAISFSCNHPECGKKDGHGLRILRLPGMDLEICGQTGELQALLIDNLLSGGQKVYPPFGLRLDEAREALQALR